MTNTTDRTKAMRLYVREGLNGAEVFGFNLYPGPRDTYSFAIVNDGSGNAMLISQDSTCTVPRKTSNGPQIWPFVNYAYTGTAHDWDPAGTADMRETYLVSLARAREGYIEFIVLGELQTGTGAAQLGDEAALTVATGKPNNCNALFNAWVPPSGAWAQNAASNIDLPGGGLYGQAAVVDVAAGTMVSYTAEALDQFYSNATAPGALHSGPATETVTLASADNSNGVAQVRVVDRAGATSFAVPRSHADAVSYVLMHTTLHGEYLLDSALDAATEWVVTLPAKRHYVNTTSGIAAAPFTDDFKNDGRACETARASLLDRSAATSNDEACSSTTSDCGISIPLYAATNVVAMRQTGDNGERTAILGALVGETGITVRVATSGSNGDSTGTMTLTFDDPAISTHENRMPVGTTSAQYVGVPAIGFAAERAVNGDAQPGILASYAGAFRHRGTLVRQPSGAE